MKQLRKAALVLLTTAALAVLFLAASSAAPALSVEQAFTQPGGGTFYGASFGDEFFNYVKAADGAILTQGEDGAWYYAGSDARYLLDPPAAPVDETDWVARQRAASPAPDRSGLLQDFSGSGASLQGVTGEQPLLILLVDFKDVQIAYESDWAALVFGAGRSVKTFYSETSGEKINIVPAQESYTGAGAANDGVVHVALNYNHPNAGSETITRDAIKAADTYVDFASYDKNNDKKISPGELHILVVCAGYEGSYGNYTPAVWGYHHSDGSFGSADGKTITTYMQIGERQAGHMATIGIICHELGHDFGLPDLYAADGQTSRGLGGFSLMANGSWGWKPGSGGDAYQGMTPVLMDAYCLELLSLFPVEPLSPGQSYSRTVKSISTGDKNILRVNIPGSKEYFLIENRQPEMNDLAMKDYMSGAAQGGVAVYRINTNFRNNYIDGEQVTILLEADGRGLLLGGDIFGVDPFYYVSGPRNVLLNRKTAPSTALQGGGSGWFNLACLSAPGASMDIQLAPILSAAPFNMTIDYRSGKGKITVTDSTGTPQFVSNNTGIVTVGPDGNVTAVKRAKGTTTITVSDDSIFTDTVTVTVRYAWWQWLILIFLFGFLWY